MLNYYPIKMKKIIVQLVEVLGDFLSLIYPNLCICCDSVLVKQEHLICSKCNIGLPRTHFHLVKDNPIEHIFWGRIKIEKASAFFLYQKGSKYQQLLHQLKYKGIRNIGVELGKLFAVELIQVNYFGDIDLIVPVPLHPKKERKRGYNQSLAIAEGVATVLQKEIDKDVLYRKRFNDTQTKKGRFERWENMNELFDVKNIDKFEGKHLLLIDDIVTTGATLEACAFALLKGKDVKVSIATLAFSSQ